MLTNKLSSSFSVFLTILFTMLLTSSVYAGIGIKAKHKDKDGNPIPSKCNECNGSCAGWCNSCMGCVSKLTDPKSCGTSNAGICKSLLIKPRSSLSN
jgi:hypothetical protein